MNLESYLLLVAFTLSNPIFAIIELVPNGTVQTDTVDLSADGDKAIVEEGGIIAAIGDGIAMNAANQAVFNFGSIFSTANNGILNLDINNLIKNSGLVSGGNLAGIRNEADNALIINSGQILNNNNMLEAHGIDNRAASCVIINSGLIMSKNRFAIANLQGIALGTNLSIINSGTIASLRTIAIENESPNFTLINSGIIRTDDSNGGNAVVSGPGAINTQIKNSGLIFASRLTSGAFNLLADDTVIVNSGTLASSGNTGAVINSSLLSGIQVINSGVIKSTDRSTPQGALGLLSTNNTLSLLRGSNIEGSVLIANDLTLNVETGLNLALTLAPGSAGFTTLGIEAPFAVMGDTIAVIDPTGFALQNDVLADLSDTIFDGIYRHRTGFPCPCYPCGCGVWIQGIGSTRKRSCRTKSVGYDNWQGGFLVGYDVRVCGGYSSLFGGISFGEAEVDEKTQRSDWTTYLWGLTYEWFCRNSFLGLAYAIGYVDLNNDRFVMNNLAEGGVETATVDTGGAFISTEVTAAKHFPSLFCSTMSFTFRYAGLFLGDYKERGALANLSVKDREINLLTTRFEVAFPYQSSQGIYCWVVEPYLGLYGRCLIGESFVDGFLLGQSLCFNPGSPNELVAFLLGFRGIQSFGRFNFFLNFEGSFDNYSSSRLLGEGGIGFSF